MNANLICRVHGLAELSTATSAQLTLKLELHLPSSLSLQRHCITVSLSKGGKPRPKLSPPDSTWQSI